MKREFHRSAGFVVFRPGAERRYLLVRSALTRRPVWEFPKGAIEPGETELDAAVRELREETGLRPADYRMLEGYRDEERYVFATGAGTARRLVRKQVTYFLAEWRSGEVIISGEATRFAWVSFRDAERMVRFPAKRGVLRSAERWLRDQGPLPLIVRG